VDVVLCYSPDRLARKFAYQALLIEEFARAGVKVEFVNGPRGDSPEDQLLVQFQGMFAEYEKALQMVLRLLAFNAEAWLAEHLNAYLADPDEYRAITRNLLHHSGQLDYTPDQITVTLDRPDSPRLARALALLTDELNNTPARLPGDPRPLTYRLAQA